MTEASGCPDVATLRQLVLGLVPEADAEALEEHVLKCDGCLQTLRTIEATDSLVDAVRGQFGADIESESLPHYANDLMLRLKELRTGSKVSDTPRDATSDLNTLSQPPSGASGPAIPGYEIVEVLGRGGMGIVYKARQLPLSRFVAIKMIIAREFRPEDLLHLQNKAGLDPKTVLSRFDTERQALALMDHPNIAKVLDSGTTGEVVGDGWWVAGNEQSSSPTTRHSPLTAPSGRPYFVMELVNGVPITNYCDDNRLTTKERLELFVPVCQAIQHAHQKGIIHRDIKPSNVLVTLYDGKPVPKVIDFGVAKATEQKLTERTLFTQHGTMVGTLEYMSPEQAEISALGVDTRSDIYSLGVLLYELLTGSTPLSHMRLAQAAYGEVPRIIKEEEPPKPSIRVSDLGEALASISAQRKTEPAKLSNLMRGDLDWIVMKTLEKDRNRRYETANAFAADLQHYLNDEPVQAGPPSASYRLWKFVRRNKGPVTAGMALAALLVLGTVGTSIGLVWALQAERTANAAAAAEAQQRQDAETQRDRAAAAEKKAVEEKARADEEAAIAKAVNDFLQNDMLAEAAPDKNARAKKVTVEEVLGRAAKRVAGKFAAQPLIEAAIRQTIGDTYRALGNYAAAQPHLERAVEVRRRVLGEEHPETLASMNNLAGLYKAQSRYAKAEPLYAKTLELRRRVLGEEHADTLISMNNMAVLFLTQGQFARAEPLYVKALEVQRRVLGDEHPHTLTIMNNLGGLYQARGQLAKAEPLYVKALEIQRRTLGEEHIDTLSSMNSLAGLYMAQGKYSKAEPLFVKILEVRRRILGEEHPIRVRTMTNLAMLYQHQGQLAKAEPLYVKVLEVQRRVLGEEHHDTLNSMNNLAAILLAQGQYAKAEPLFVKTVEIKRRVLGEEHPDTLRSMNNLGGLYKVQGQFAKAEPLFVKTLEVSRHVLGEDNPSTLNFMNNLGGLYKAQGQLEKVEPLYVRTLEVGRRVLGEEHSHTLTFMNNLGGLYLTQGKYSKAEPLLVKNLEVSRRVLGEEHPDTLRVMHNLAVLYARIRKFDLAIPLLEAALKIKKAKLGPDHPETLRTMADLGGNYRDGGRLKDALPLFEDADRRIQALPPAKQQSLSWVRGELADAYERAGQREKAEAILREQMGLVKQSAGPDSPSYAGALAELGHNLLKQKKWAEAEPVLRECLAIREKKEAEIWTTFNTKSELGDALLGQKKYADAEPLLVAGYEGMKQREEKIMPRDKVRLAEALKRLVRLYDALGKKGKAAEWRKKLVVEKAAAAGRHP